MLIKDDTMNQNTSQSVTTETKIGIEPIKFNNLQKYSLILANIIINIAIVVVLQLADIIQAPILNNQQVNDFSPVVRNFILFLQLVFIAGILPFTIYDILTNNYLKTIKLAQNYLVIIGTVSSFLLMLWILDAAISNNQTLYYLGPPSEILISVLLLAVILYNLPGYLLLKYYNL